MRRLLVSVVALFPVLLHAASAPPPLMVQPVLPNTLAKVSRTPIHKSSPRNFSFAFGPGFSFLRTAYAKDNGLTNAGISANIGALTSLTGDPNLLIGADAGLDFWSNEGSQTLSTRANGVRLLPTVIYHFDVAGLPRSLSPFIGAAAGPYLYFARTKDLQGETVASNTTVYLAVFLRAGMTWEVVPELQFSLEPKIGLIGTHFTFVPQLVAHLSL